MPTALIAEDEELPRAELRRMLAAAWPELDIVAECEHGPAAVEAIDAHVPDVAFLDIRMPGLSGLDVTRAASGRCHVVFTTAYDSHAVTAFEAGAVDYLLKPVSAERLARAVARLRERLDSRREAPAVHELVERLARHLAPRDGGAERLRWLSASVGDTIKLFGIDEVLFFQSDEKHTRVVTAGDEAHVRKPLKEIAEGLDPDEFWQVHRGVIVRASAIARAARRAGAHLARAAPAPREAGGEPGLGLAIQGDVGAAPRPDEGLAVSAARRSITPRSCALAVMRAACSNSAHASSARPSRTSRSPRTACSRW
jgi:DNA-binding LytR/AlgR family response regulator